MADSVKESGKHHTTDDDITTPGAARHGAQSHIGHHVVHSSLTTDTLDLGGHDVRGGAVRRRRGSSTASTDSIRAVLGVDYEPPPREPDPWDDVRWLRSRSRLRGFIDRITPSMVKEVGGTHQRFALFTFYLLLLLFLAYCAYLLRQAFGDRRHPMNTLAVSTELWPLPYLVVCDKLAASVSDVVHSVYASGYSGVIGDPLWQRTAVQKLDNDTCPQSATCFWLNTSGVLPTNAVYASNLTVNIFYHLKYEKANDKPWRQIARVFLTDQTREQWCASGVDMAQPQGTFDLPLFSSLTQAIRNGAYVRLVRNTTLSYQWYGKDDKHEKNYYRARTPFVSIDNLADMLEPSATDLLTWHATCDDGQLDSPSSAPSDRHIDTRTRNNTTDSLSPHGMGRGLVDPGFGGGGRGGVGDGLGVGGIGGGSTGNKEAAAGETHTRASPSAAVTPARDVTQDGRSGGGEEGCGDVRTRLAALYDSLVDGTTTANNDMHAILLTVIQEPSVLSFRQVDPVNLMTLAANAGGFWSYVAGIFSLVFVLNEAGKRRPCWLFRRRGWEKGLRRLRESLALSRRRRGEQPSAGPSFEQLGNGGEEDDTGSVLRVGGGGGGGDRDVMRASRGGGRTRGDEKHESVGVLRRPSGGDGGNQPVEGDLPTTTTTTMTDTDGTTLDAPHCVVSGAGGGGSDDGDSGKKPEHHTTHHRRTHTGRSSSAGSMATTHVSDRTGLTEAQEAYLELEHRVHLLEDVTKLVLDAPLVWDRASLLPNHRPVGTPDADT